MAEDNNIVLHSDDPTLGAIEISPQVLEIVSGIAALEVEGVNRMRNSFATSVNELLGRKNEHSKGIKLTYSENKLIVDIFAFLDYGVSVPKVALEIQDKVKQQLLFMTDIEVQEVNVHVQGVVTEKTSASSEVDPNNPFANNENGE